jgi:hypothetical protein
MTFQPNTQPVLLLDGFIISSLYEKCTSAGMCQGKKPMQEPQGSFYFWCKRELISVLYRVVFMYLKGVWGYSFKAVG